LGLVVTDFAFGFAAFDFAVGFGFPTGFGFEIGPAPRVRPGPAWERRRPVAVEGREGGIRHPFAG